MKSTALTIFLVLLLILAWNATYVVNETQQTVKTMFGKPVGDPVTTPGLKFKLPFFHRVHYFDKRFLEWDGEANEFPTRDKRLIVMDTYARWQITDPLLFFQRLRDERSAQTRLDDILDGATRDAVANHDLIEVVRSSNREPRRDDTLAEAEQASLDPIQTGRDTIRQQILGAAQAATEDLGIVILDLRLKRINYAEAVRQEVYQRMIAERKRIAARYRSEGDGEASRILGQRDRDLKEIQSDAYRQAEEVRGKADAEATTIFAAAYDRSADTRDFYEFLKSMETLEVTVDPETLMILSTDGEFYRFLKDSGG